MISAIFAIRILQVRSLIFFMGSYSFSFKLKEVERLTVSVIGILLTESGSGATMRRSWIVVPALAILSALTLSSTSTCHS